MARGGPRQGQPGRQYPNRRDMQRSPRQPAQAVPGQTYGERKRQLESQQVIPLPRQVAPPPAAGGLAALAGRVGGGSPGPLIDLSAPTTRPDEPLTAGLPTGPGPGPEVLNLPPALTQDDHMLAELRGIYRAYPSNDLARLIAELTAKQARTRPNARTNR